MLETTRETARTVVTGTRAMAHREQRPVTVAGARPPEARRKTNVLPSYPSRAALEATARRQAYLVRGRERFILESRVIAVGVPLGIAAGVLAWRSGSTRGGRSLARFVAAFATTVGLTLLEATAEWRGMETRGR